MIVLVTEVVLDKPSSNYTLVDRSFLLIDTSNPNPFVVATMILTLAGRWLNNHHIIMIEGYEAVPLVFLYA